MILFCKFNEFHNSKTYLLQNTVMCIFSAPVKHVSNTKIWVGRSIDKDGKIEDTVVYRNQVGFYDDDKSAPVGMVLPVPAKEVLFPENQKQFTKELFHSLESAFTRGYGTSATNSTNGREDSYLECKVVGDYIISFAASVNDLVRANPNVFHFKVVDFMNVLKNNYPENKFGYIIAQLSSTADKRSFHPLAYTYEVNNANSSMFVPTLHIHPNDNSSDEFKFTINETADDWDHEIYLTPLFLPSWKQTFSLDICKNNSTETLDKQVKLIHEYGGSNIKHIKSTLNQMFGSSNTRSFEICASIKLQIKDFHPNGDLQWNFPDDFAMKLSCKECKNEINEPLFYTCSVCRVDFCNHCFSMKQNIHPDYHSMIVNRSSWDKLNKLKTELSKQNTGRRTNGNDGCVVC